MPEDDIIGELEELSQMVEGEEDIEKGLQEIEKITKTVPEAKEEQKAEKTAVAGTEPAKKKEEKAKAENQKKEEKKSQEEKKEEMEEEKKQEEKKPEQKVEPPKAVKKPVPPAHPERAIKTGLGFKFASAILIIVGLGIYALAYYLRWNGWHLITYPPSSAVALGGTVLIIAGGEIYYRSKER